MNRQEAEELLPWFVTGSLNADETRAVQAFIDSGEISAAELNEVSLFAETINEQSAHEPEYNPAILDNAMAKLDAVVQEAPDEPLIVREPMAEPGLLERISTFFKWDDTPRVAKLAIGAQFAAVLAMVVFVTASDNGGSFFPRGAATFESVAGTAAVTTADLTIEFAAGTTLEEVTALLITVDGRIVDGPDTHGLYNIALPEDADITALQTELSASALTTFVQPVQP